MAIFIMSKGPLCYSIYYHHYFTRSDDLSRLISDHLPCLPCLPSITPPDCPSTVSQHQYLYLNVYLSKYKVIQIVSHQIVGQLLEYLGACANCNSVDIIAYILKIIIFQMHFFLELPVCVVYLLCSQIDN